MPQLLKVNTNRFSSRSIIQVHVAIASILNGKERNAIFNTQNCSWVVKKLENDHYFRK